MYLRNSDNLCDIESSTLGSAQPQICLNIPKPTQDWNVPMQNKGSVSIFKSTQKDVVNLGPEKSKYESTQYSRQYTTYRCIAPWSSCRTQHLHTSAPQIAGASSVMPEPDKR